MTANGVSSLCIARLMLYPNRTYPSPFDPVKEDDDKLRRCERESERFR